MSRDSNLALQAAIDLVTRLISGGQELRHIVGLLITEANISRETVMN